MKKIVAVLLTVIMISAVLAGCAGGETDGETSDSLSETAESTSEQTDGEGSDSTEADTEAKDTEEKKDGEYTIVYAIGSSIYSDRSAVQSAVTDLQKSFDKNARMDINAMAENSYISQNSGIEGNKIVVGYLANDPIAKEIYNSLHTAASYVIKFVEESIYIVGGSGEATAVAVDHFINGFLIKYGNLIFDMDKIVFAEENEPARFEGLTVAGNPLESYMIVYDGSAIGEIYANKLKRMIILFTGVSLPVIKAPEEAGEYEIVIGSVDREESNAIRDAYSRSNVYYTVKTVGSRLVCVGEGWHTLDAMISALETYLSGIEGDTVDLDGEMISGDVLETLDKDGMLERAEDTDIRVLNYNVFGATYNYAKHTFFSNNKERGETIGDIMMAYDPDIITTNELYFNSDVYKAIMTQISDDYILIESEYDDGYPFEGSSSGGRKNPEQIFIKKSCNFKVIASGWRYLSEGGSNMVTYHGIHWAVLETESGKRFIVSVGHYGESNSTAVYAVEHQAAIAMAQEASGSSEILPVIAAGDFFSHVDWGAAYKYHTVECGLKDPQRIEEINCNSSTLQATCHDFGETNSSGTRYDFILHSDLLTPLKFKVLKSNVLNYTSDHYPVCVDFKFT